MSAPCYGNFVDVCGVVGRATLLPHAPARAARVHAGGREVQRAAPIPLVDLVQRAEKGTAILRGIAQVQLALLGRPIADVQQDDTSLDQECAGRVGH